MADTTLFDIYDFYEAPWWQNPWLLAAVALSLLLIGVAVWYFLRKKRPKTSWERALEAVNNLQPESFKHQHDFKQFYFTLSQITKRYLDERYNWKTCPQTDEELLYWLEQTHSAHPCTAIMKTMVERMQQIKFANVEAIKLHAVRDKGAIIDLITATKPTT